MNPQNKLSKETEEKIVELLASGMTKQAVANAMGINVRTLYRITDRLGGPKGLEKLLEEHKADSTPVELPDFPDDDISTEDIIATMERRFERRHDHARAKRWFEIKVNIDGPFGIMWYGDPHLDSNGCNWPLLTKHTKLHQKCPALLAANVGDTTDNWVGNLMRLYADSDQSRGTAHRLARWFLLEAKIPWFLWILGNHDKWNDGDTLLRALNVNKILMEDRAQFCLTAPNGRQWRIWAEHNFKGHSMWNTLHGPQKAAHMKDMAHLYINGHTHNWALHQEESASREFTYWLARARGYKFVDSYSDDLGHFPQCEGASVVSIHDPDATSMAGFMTCFADPEEATEYLIWKRSRK